MMRPITVLLVDDHRLVREGIRLTLGRDKGLRIVGEAADGASALRRAKVLKPDVALMDLSLPEMSGIETTRRLSKSSPGIKVLALTMHAEKPYVVQMVQAGARGYVLKDSAPSELARAIRAVHGGGSHFSAPVAKFILDDYVARRGRARDDTPDLSRREREVLALIAQGLGSRAIAGKIGVAVRTAETYRERLMRKLDIHKAVGLARYALAHGFAPNPSAS